LLRWALTDAGKEQRQAPFGFGRAGESKPVAGGGPVPTRANKSGFAWCLGESGGGLPHSMTLSRNLKPVAIRSGFGVRLSLPLFPETRLSGSTSTIAILDT
jgi:hypothetical protein